MTDTLVTTTAPDHDELVRVVHLYTDGFGAGKPAMFREAFHDDAWIFFNDDEGHLTKLLLADVFEEWASSPDDHIVCRIISVTQAGDIANVLLGFDGPNAADIWWVDSHNLLKIGGTWKDMNKTATHSTRSGWAAVPGQPPESPADYDEITTVVRRYIDHMGSGDAEAIKAAYDKDAWIFFTTTDGSLKKSRVWDWAEDWAEEDGTKYRARIVSVTQAGDVATVLVGCDHVNGLDESWLDLINLLQIEGVWKITNVTATHSSRAAGV